MSNEQENIESPLQEKQETQPSSFLANVIASTEKEGALEEATIDKNTLEKNASEKIKKPREPLSTATVLKAIGALIVVLIIFFGSFLAYIVFHPEQAYFFVNIFGINPNDIATILKKLINISF